MVVQSTFNLYAKDGKTVIGKMEVTYGGTIIK